MRSPFRMPKAASQALIALALCLTQVAVASGEPVPRIIVTGEGSSDVEPDMAILHLTVSREAATAREALSENSAAMRKVLDAMSTLGIDKRDLQTSNFQIQPRYTYPPQPVAGVDAAPRLVGYIVRNSLAVRVRDMDRVGEVLDTSVTLGVNEGGSLLFTNDDPAAAIGQARLRAMEDALAKARTLAGAAGVRLGKVLEISEQNYGPLPRPMMARAEMAVVAGMAADVPIAAGENTYRVTVNVSLAIEQ